MTCANYECLDVLSPGLPRYIELKLVRMRRVDVEKLVDESVFSLRDPLDVSSVETHSIWARDG